MNHAGISRWIALGSVACLLACGCFRKLDETITADSASLIVFEGSGGPVTIVIDGAVVAEAAYLEPSSSGGPGGVRYKVSKGRHDVEVRRGAETIVRRQVYVGDGETRSISVPSS